MADTDKNTRTSNQAWRKKPRKYAPKSRLGCKTCKIRRVKCDEAKPSCSKCQSTGRKCDGYGTTAIFVSHTQTEAAHGYQSGLLLARAPQPWAADKYQPFNISPCQSLGPFMVLAATGSAQADAMSFFEYTSIKHLNEHYPCESWRKMLMLFSQTVPAVRSAAVALALAHRNYLDSPSSDSSCTDQTTPLIHYNRAIQLLLAQDCGGNSTDKSAITLLVCYLFICFDHLAGNYVQAMKHLRGGVDLSRQIDSSLLTPATGALISQVRQQIRRLDMQAVTFLVDWTPADIQEIPAPRPPLLLPHHALFPSLDQAADQLQLLVSQVMRLRHTIEQHPTPSPTDHSKPPALPSSPSYTNHLLEQLQTWSNLFESHLLQHSRPSRLNTSRISLLRLQYTITLILLSAASSPLPSRELAYDNFLPQFQQCLILARDVASAHEQYSLISSLSSSSSSMAPPRPTFTPEVGIVPVLYMIGVKCRDPVVRRAAVGLLRGQRIREAVWDSFFAARVVERVVEIEEGGVVRGRRGINSTCSMRDIQIWQRVENLTWVVHEVGGEGRLDVVYRFCGMEEVVVERLAL